MARYWLGARDAGGAYLALAARAAALCVLFPGAHGHGLCAEPGVRGGYGYIAAYNQRVEGVMVAVLDILQSIPVLSFLPGVMLAMVALFPTRQLGVEFGAIMLIFTGQVWNMAFSFYAR